MRLPLYCGCKENGFYRKQAVKIMGLAAVVLEEGDRMRYPYGKVLRAVWKYLCAYFKIVLKWLVLAGIKK